jgi:hypothetical protein
MSKIAAAVVLILVMLSAGDVPGAPVDGCRSDFRIWKWVGLPSCGQMAINICPAGDFEPIWSGCGAYMSPGDYAIEIFAKDASNNPIQGIPATDFWLNSCDPSKTLALCASPVTADSSTGPDGRTTLSGRIKGGGCNIPAGSLTGQGVYMTIQGKMLLAKPFPCSSGLRLCVPIRIKSPDTGGPGGAPDGVVNLSDFVRFCASYNTAWGVPPPPGKAFNACMDYDDDNKCNLIDFSLFREHYLHQCP